MRLKIKFKKIIKGILYEKNKISKEKNIIYLRNTKGIRRVLLLMTPEYGNLGDHAIAYATLKFLNDNFHDNTLIEITQRQLIYYFKNIMNNITDKDIVLITGGGYFGNLWFDDGEYIVRKIIKKCNHNKIIILPMTMFFTQNVLRNIELKKSMRIYSNHDNLYVFCREKSTYELLKRNSKIDDLHLFLIPDMVLYLSPKEYDKYNTILICLRNDKEKNNEIDTDKLLNYLKVNTNYKFQLTTTRLNHDINIEDRNKYLTSKLKEFTESRLVITDRLHAMLFAYITCTPCIAIDNISHKISGVYEWIKDLDFIYLAKNTDEVTNHLKMMYEYNGKKSAKDFSDYYLILKEVLKSE